MTSQKFKPRCDSDKQATQCITSDILNNIACEHFKECATQWLILQVTCLYLKSLGKTYMYNMYLRIIAIIIIIIVIIIIIIICKRMGFVNKL